MPKGYWQLALCENSRDIRTLSTHLGNVCPMRVPMGVRISGNIFDARVAAVLAHCEHTCHNRDDILIGAELLEELYLEWEKVLTAYETCGFTLDPNKKFVLLTEIEWHGFLFSSQGAKSSPQKVFALFSVPRPITHDGLLSFIVLVRLLQFKIYFKVQ